MPSGQESRIIQQGLQGKFGGADEGRRTEFGRPQLDVRGLIQE